MIGVIPLVLVVATMGEAPSGPHQRTTSAATNQQRSPDKPLRSEKESRTPAQRKINSQVLYEIYRYRGEAREKNVPPDPTGVRIDEKHRALVDVRTEVTRAIEKKLRDAGSAIVSTSPENRSIFAWIPLLKIEQIAAEPSVRAVEPVADATHK
jgi:hypothetical protein